jgi:PAS domain S-box-containing protein
MQVHYFNSSFFYYGGLWLKAGVTLLIWLALSISGETLAEGGVDSWRNEVATTRILAENDAPAAYREAERLQSTIPADATPIDQARLLNLLARVEVYLALTESAAKHAQQAFDLAKQHADKVGQVEANLNVALNAVNQAKLDLMVAAVTDSMEIIDGVDRPDLLAETMLRTAMMYRRQEQFDDFITMSIQTMEIAKRSNNHAAVTFAHQGMALAYDQSGRTQDAYDHYMLMRKQAVATQMRRLEADAMVGMGRMSILLGNVSSGESLIREAVGIYREVGSPFSLSFGLYALAESLHHQGKTAASLPVLNEAVAIYKKYPNKIGLWWTLNARSTYEQSLGHANAANADAERAYVLAKRIDFPVYLSESAKRLAAIAAERGDHQRAYALLAEAEKMSVQAAQKNAGTRMLTLSKRYETESKQREIDQLNLHNERQASELRQTALQQQWLWTVLGSSVVILMGVAVFLLRLRQSHRQLQQIQSHQQAILDAIPDLMFELGLDGRYYSCYTLHSDLLVESVSNLLGKTVSDVMPKDAAEVCLSALQEAYEKGMSTSKVLELPLPQGKCWFELSVARKATQGGEEPRFIGISRDITERKQLEMKLNEREREFRTLVERSPDNIARYDLQCQIRYINPQLKKTLGAAAYGLLGNMSNGEGDHFKVNYDEYQAKITAVLRTGRDDEIELTLPDTGEGERYHHVRFVAERDEHGDIVGVLAIGRDVTEHRQVERLLLNLSNGIPGLLGAYRQRPDGSAHQVFASPGLYDLFGVTFEEIKDDSTPRLERVHPDDLRASLAIMEVAVCTMSPAWNEVRVHHPIKGEIWVETYATPVRESDGSIIWYGYSAEVTKRHQLQEALKDRELQLRTLVENLPDFVVRLDKYARHLYVNPAVTKASGLPFEYFVGKTALEVGLTGDKAGDVLLVDAALSCAEKGVPIMSEMIFRYPQGDRVFDIMHVPERNEFGEVASVLAVARDITEMRTAHNELQEKEALLRALIDSIPDLIFFKDTDSVYLGFNKAFAEFCGHQEAQLVGKTDYHIATREVANAFRQYDNEMLISGITQHHDEWVTFPDGREVLLDTMRAPLLDVNGSVVGMIGISRDITERYRMEQELIKREREFRTLAENSPSVIVRYDLDCRRIYVNRTFLEVNPEVANAALGSTPLEFWNVLSMTGEEYIGHLRNIIATGESSDLLVEFLDKNGLMAYHSISLVPEFNEHGRVMGVLSICHDVTYIKRIEAMLRKSELEFRTLAENSPEMIVRYDHDCRRVYINPAYERQTGIPIKKAWNKTPDDVWKPIMPRDEYVKRIKQVMHTGEPDQILLEWQGADGALVSHLMHAVVEYDEQGIAVGVLVIGHNITKLKTSERQLEESQRMLRMLAARSEIVREDERKSLAREVHDELGQHLMALRMGVTAIGIRFGENNPGLQEETTQFITLVDSTIQVVRNIMVSLRPNVLDMGIVPALEWLVDEYQNRTGITCEMHVYDENIYLDEKRATAIFRIVQESLTNIGKHAKACKVDIMFERNGPYYVLRVCDNGKGFDPDARKNKSFGLIGMRERVLMLGGELEVLSAPISGTVIKVSIPVNYVWSEE